MKRIRGDLQIQLLFKCAGDIGVVEQQVMKRLNMSWQESERLQAREMKRNLRHGNDK